MDKVKYILILIWTLLILRFCTSPVEGYKLGSGYTYYSDIMIITGVDDQILNHIVAFNYNDKYIVAKQLTDSLYRIARNFDAKSICDITKEDDVDIAGVLYWIIIKEERRTIGPFNLNDYLDKKRKYNITLKIDGFRTYNIVRYEKRKIR